MARSIRSRLLTLLLSLEVSCATQYEPRLVARGEITLRYDVIRGLEPWAGRQRITSPWIGYGGLQAYVRCVPAAKRHAKRAQAGAVGSMLSTFGSAVLSGLGIGFSVRQLDDQTIYNQDATNILFGVGSLSLLLLREIVFVPLARSNLLDAVNYYNDAVGSLGATCVDPTPEPPMVFPIP